MPFAADGTITWELLCDRNNADLSNVLGNLVKRTLAMSNQYFNGKVKNFNVTDVMDEDLKEIVTNVRDKVFAHVW